MTMTISQRAILSSILIFAIAGCSEEKAQDPGLSRDAAGSREGGQAPSRDFHVPGNPPVAVTMPAMEVISSDVSSLMALTPEEAAWLDRNGYPTPEALGAVSTFDVNALESAVRNERNATAAALLGHRRVQEGDLGGAVAAFSAGANMGSLYARQQLALISTQRATGLPIEALSQADQGNLQVMVAQLEVAKMLGDHRAQAYIDKYTSNFDWRGYGRHVLTQTAEFMRQYGEYTRARGEPTRGPDPRPNAEIWKRLEAEPYSTVTVYRRDGTSP